jgi:hypothetical protein
MRRVNDCNNTFTQYIGIQKKPSTHDGLLSGQWTLAKEEMNKEGKEEHCV